MSEAEIAAFHAEFEKLIEKQDADGLAALYTPDGRFLAPDFPAFEGTDAITQAFQGFIAGGYRTVKITPVVTEIHGDTAISHGRYVATGTTPDGDFTENGKTLEVMKKQADGSWKYSIDMFNRDAPAG